mmetsp:Transcript_18842/g.64829  ORF Transcript_18842/g.64829 Transcript_18842/m.64829 type:complete len:390 (-) Transcript_18842:249-1418(-)
MTPRAPPRPLHFEKTSRASASRFAESVASHFTMLAARPMLSDHSSPPACFTSQRYASAAAATSPASRSSEASRRAMAIGCIIIFWQSKGTVRAARTAASAPARSPRSRRMATRSSTSSSLAALACGGGGGASAYMLALPRWKQGMYAAVAFLLFITFVMTCASLGDADALELRVDALEADLAGTKSQLRASLGSNYDCSNTFGVLPNGAQSSKVVESPWGHAYQVVVSPLHVTTDLTSGLNYYDAVFDSAKRCHDGRRGYLATITSQKEQAFINDLLPETAKLNKYFYNVWLGGQDTKTEGEWRWANGPELGVGFWHGFAKDQGGSSWAGAFQNWYCYQDSSWPYCQPNNGGNAGNQDCLSMYGDGTWNDLDCGLRTQAYVVEYGNDVL